MEKPFASLTLCVREIRDTLRGRGVRTLSCNLSVAHDDFIPSTLCEVTISPSKELMDVEYTGLLSTEQMHESTNKRVVEVEYYQPRRA
ncbi:hypothetical protein ACFX11_038519 [Malus domestica]